MVSDADIFRYRVALERGISAWANPGFFVRKLLQSIARKWPLPPPVRVLLQALRGVRFADRKCVFIGEDVMFDEVFPCLISVGRNVMITEGVMILTHLYDPDYSTHVMKLGKIDIEDNVFIGARSIIMNGVHLGAGCVVGAGSIVTKDVPANAIVVGVPARMVGSRGNADASDYVDLSGALARCSRCSKACSSSP